MAWGGRISASVPLRPLRRPSMGPPWMTLLANFLNMSGQKSWRFLAGNSLPECRGPIYRVPFGYRARRGGAGTRLATLFPFAHSVVRTNFASRVIYPGECQYLLP